jgi:hypothetical protein
MPVYTSRGVGVYRPPVRFRCPPELTVVTLGASVRDEYDDRGSDEGFLSTALSTEL